MHLHLPLMAGLFVVPRQRRIGQGMPLLFALRRAEQSVEQRPAGQQMLLPATALTALLGWDAVRVWLPSLSAVPVASDTAALPPAGLVIIGIITAGLLAALTIRPRTYSTAWLLAVGVLAAARILSHAATHHAGRLTASTLGVLAAVVAIGCIAGGARPAATARLGVLTGIAASVASHAALGSIDLVWMATPTAQLASATLAVSAFVAAWMARTALTPEGDESSAWPWLFFGPLLFIVGVVLASPGRLAVAVRWVDPLIAAMIVTQAGLLVLGAVAIRRLSARTAAPVAGALVLVGTAGSLQLAGFVPVAAQLLLAAGLGASTSVITSSASSLSRTRAAAGSGGALFAAILGVAYYAPHTIRLPYPPPVVLLLAAVSIAVMALATTRRLTAAPVRERGIGQRSVAVATATALLASLAALAAPATPVATSAPGESGATMRVMLVHAGAGFDVDGQLALDRLTDRIAEEDPAILVLNDVDRGTWRSGNRDLLRIVRHGLGLPYLFGPAIDDLQGNALLTRHGVREGLHERLPRGSDPAARGQVVAVIEAESDRPIAVIATALSADDPQTDTRVPQARAVAATVARLRDRGLPVLVVGGLNAEPGSAELASFGDIVQPALPAEAMTWPAPSPQRQIDHVLASDDVEVLDARVIDDGLSPHLMVVVDLRLRELEDAS